MAVGTNKVARVTVEGLYQSAISIQNVYHLRNDGTSVDEADALEDFVEVLEALYDIIEDIISAVLVIQRIRAINLTDGTDIGIDAFVDSTPGAGAGNTAPPQVAYGLNLSTNRLGAFGRKFFGPVEEGAVANDGVLTAGTISDLGDAGDYLVTPQVATHSTWRAGIVSTVDEVFLPFTSWSVSVTAVTQRRRRLGVGS